jgi:Fe(3+) dicitrate transport protein
MQKWFFIVFICAQLSSYSQSYNIKANILNQDQQPLYGVMLMIGDQVIFSDLQGQVKFTSNQKNTQFSLQYLGMKDTTISTVLQQFDTHLGTIVMEESGTIMKEVNISSTQMTYRGNIQGTNYYVSPLVIKKMQPISTEEVLKTLPGVNVLGDMGLGNRINVSIRGSWGRRSEKVLMLEDGSPISPAPYIGPGIYYNPISERVSGIEVYTGADVLRYGPNNMFGIINYLTPKPSQKPTITAKVTTGQRGLFAGLLSYSGTWNKVGTHIEAIYKKFDGFTQFSSIEMLNFNAKIFAELSHNQSIFFKISSQFEDNNATLSSITPFTFRIDPTLNPFDADRFTMHRYGLDLKHKWTPTKSTSLNTRIFASDFARDWYRQNNIVIPASQVRSYVGERIFSEKYKYLEGKEFSEDDFVRVGSLNSKKRESSTNSRWHYTVIAADQTFTNSLFGDQWSNNIEAQIKYHRETYQDMIIAADSSRWARTGRFTTDLDYVLHSISGYVRNHFIYKNLHITPILRWEQVWMDRQDRLALANNPNINTDKDNVRTNSFNILQPGITFALQHNNHKWFGSVYRGYIAPSKYFAFLVERDGILVQPLSTELLSNVKPEISINSELGVRGEWFKGQLSGQIAVFNNRISNFYLAGWNEFFDKLGVINVQGAELSLKWDIIKHQENHKLSLQPNITLLRSRVISGELHDRHLFTQIRHTDLTRQELLDKATANPNGYTFYTKNADGQEMIFNPLVSSDLNKVTKTVYKYGNQGISDGQSPYAPALSYNINLNYGYKKWNIGLSYNYVGDQYAEFANFENVSGDGGLGKIEAFSTYDINLGVDFSIKKVSSHFFIAGKNLGDDIVTGSRLNRGQSGIMPIGFRQINSGITFEF